MDFPRSDKTVQNEGFSIFSGPDLESPLYTSFNEQPTRELIEMPSQSPLADLQNPVAGYSTYESMLYQQLEMSYSGTGTPVGDESMPMIIDYPCEDGLGINKENSVLFKSGAHSGLCNMEVQNNVPLISPGQCPAGMGSLSSSLIPTSTPKVTQPVLPRKRLAIARKGNLRQGHDAQLRRFSPAKLIKHLEDMFRSNDSITDVFRRDSMACLVQMNNLVRQEMQYGTPAGRKFLSGKDGETEKFGVDDSSELSSPSQLRNTPTLDSPFTIYSDSFGDLSAFMTATASSSTQSIANKRNTIYYCTYPKCARQFKTRADWTRHETSKQHWVQEQYMCPKCVVAEPGPQNILCCKFCPQYLVSMDDAKSHCLQCDRAKTESRTFLRKDKVGDHLQTAHGILDVPEELKSWTYNVSGDWPKQCGFCDKHFKDWEERANDIEGHFKEGKTIADYKQPFPLPADPAVQCSYSYLGRDDDDDDNEGGGDGWNRTQGRGLYSQMHGFNWHGNNSSSAGETQSQNRSGGTSNEKQYSHLSSTALTDLILRIPKTTSSTANLSSKISSTPKHPHHNNSSSKPSPTGKIFPVIDAHLLLLSAISTFSTISHLPHHSQNTAIPKYPLSAGPSPFTTSLIPRTKHAPFPQIRQWQQKEHSVKLLYRQDSEHQTPIWLLVTNEGNLSVAGQKKVGRGGGRRRGRHCRERSWNGGLEREFERALVLRGE